MEGGIFEGVGVRVARWEGAVILLSFIMSLVWIWILRPTSLLTESILASAHLRLKRSNLYFNN